MSLEQFLENLTLEELEELKRLKENQNKRVFLFSQIRDIDLKKLFDLKRVFLVGNIFDEWFNSDIQIKDDDLRFLNNLLNNEKELIKIYKEEDLKVKFIAPILNQIDFTMLELNIRDFYEELLSYETDSIKLKGVCDFFVSKGIKTPETPYFFIQEFKKSIEGDDPEPQLLAEMICAVELNNFSRIKGAYIVGAIWNFVILERLEKHKYVYYVSANFDSTKIDDLKAIYKNLLFVKNEIIELN
jgi:hypothetical protein